MKERRHAKNMNKKGERRRNIRKQDMMRKENLEVRRNEECVKETKYNN